MERADRKTPLAAPTPAPAAILEEAPAAGPRADNTLQRAATVLKRLKVPAPVGAGVLAAHGLTRTALVDPAEFEAKVTSWLAAPAGSK